MKSLIMQGFRVKADAFVTIEYCLLMPVVLLLYTFLVYIGLFQYNRCLLQSNTFILGVECADIAENDVESRAVILKQKEKQLYDEKYLLMENLQVNYYVKEMGSVVKSSADMANPFAVFGIGETNWEMETECTVNDMSPSEILRLCKQTGKLLEEFVEEEETEDAGT